MMDKDKKTEVRQEYTDEIQRIYVEFLLSCPEAFVRCRSILDESYFNARLKKVVRDVMAYADKNSVLPPIEYVNAQHGMTLQKLENISELTSKAFLDEIELFCRHKAVENVIYSGQDMIAKGNYAEIEKRIKDAVLISLQRELGTAYFEDPRARLLRLRDKNGMISTGWKVIDNKLYGGMNRGELNLFAGAPGTGKSLFLQNITLNWLLAGLNVIYITAELSEDLVSMRLDSMLTQVPTRDIFSKLDQVELSVKLKSKNAGHLQIKYLPPGTTTNDIKSYLREFIIQSNILPDAIAVDYLDLIYPNNKRINPTDLFVKDKFVAEELRALATEMNALCVSASQLNRSSIQEQEHDMSMIAGGLSKINTADNVFSIYTSEPMRERGEYRIQFIKTRSSAGVGSKVTLAYNPASLRIADMEDSGQARTKDVSDITAELQEKRRSQREGATEDGANSETSKEDVRAKAASLRSLLARISQ